MCDFSLMHAKSRPANVGEKLITKNFDRGTLGFASASEADTPANDATAVCVLPGTELAFDKPVEIRGTWDSIAKRIEILTARFRQIDKDCAHTHHDALEFGDGQFVKLTHIVQGQTATVLQLPAAPKNEQEAKDQERLAIVA